MNDFEKEFPMKVLHGERKNFLDYFNLLSFIYAYYLYERLLSLLRKSKSASFFHWSKLHWSRCYKWSWYIYENIWKSHMRTVPQIFINDECLGGYDSISALHENGKLVEKLWM